MIAHFHLLGVKPFIRLLRCRVDMNLRVMIADNVATAMVTDLARGLLVKVGVAHKRSR